MSWAQAWASAFSSRSEIGSAAVAELVGQLRRRVRADVDHVEVDLSGEGVPAGDAAGDRQAATGSHGAASRSRATASRSTVVRCGVPTRTITARPPIRRNSGGSEPSRATSRWVVPLSAPGEQDGHGLPSGTMPQLSTISRPRASSPASRRAETIGWADAPRGGRGRIGATAISGSHRVGGGRTQHRAGESWSAKRPSPPEQARRAEVAAGRQVVDGRDAGPAERGGPFVDAHEVGRSRARRELGDGDREGSPAVVGPLGRRLPEQLGEEREAGAPADEAVVGESGDQFVGGADAAPDHLGDPTGGHSVDGVDRARPARSPGRRWSTGSRPARWRGRRRRTCLHPDPGCQIRRWPRRSSQPHPASRSTSRPVSLMRSATTMAGSRIRVGSLDQCGQRGRRGMGPLLDAGVHRRCRRRPGRRRRRWPRRPAVARAARSSSISSTRVSYVGVRAVTNTEHSGRRTPCQGGDPTVFCPRAVTNTEHRAALAPRSTVTGPLVRAPRGLPEARLMGRGLELGRVRRRTARTQSLVAT